ncbi:MAG: T9SS type A sorting domain-containing protein [Phaeodactylibacter sp.]|nr:T9SS type A sorting domain-containing protein [Phaeodactylibacter sp.]
MNVRNVTLWTLLFAALFSTNMLAQERNCGSMEYLELQKQNDPKRADKLRIIEAHTAQVIANQTRVDGIITIPTVVHVIYNTSSQNISSAQILSQIQVLNDDFRRMNADADGTWPQAADSEIEFCLATVDPQGNSTNGVTRTQTSVTGFSTNDAMKFNSSGGHDAWPAGDYLNIWVCNISGGILGYAQFPGGSPSTDGVVIDYQYFGTTGTATAPFDLGRTATHEVGHWLNLRHIWGDGGCGVDDFVSDTPTSDAPNYGCALGHVSCSSTDMVQNYMDYSDDACMNLYTSGQSTRMRALFNPGGARESLLASAGCGTPGGPTCSDGIQNGDETGVDCGGSCPACPTPCTDNEVTVTINLDNYPEETSWEIANSSGSVVASGGTYASQPDGSSVSITECLVDGCYDFTIYDSYGDGICCSYGNGSYAVTDASGNVLASGGTFGSSETTNFCLNSGPAPTCNDGIQNGDETGVDCGGSSCPPCGGGGGCTDVTIDYNEFVNTWGIWNDGGNDCRISSADAAYANTQPYCVRLRDDSGSSNMYTDALDLSGYDEITVTFTYLTLSMESGEDFFLEVSTRRSSDLTPVGNWASGADFSNNVREFESVTVTGPFSANTRIRFRCDASAKDRKVYLDDLLIEGCQSSARLEGEDAVAFQFEAAAELKAAISNVSVFPNPANDFLNINYNLTKDAAVQLTVMDLAGKVIEIRQLDGQAGEQTARIETGNVMPGFYFVQLTTEGQNVSKKFVVVR